MSGSDVMERFTAIAREVLGDDDLVLKPETTAADVPGWDSVAMVSMILATEERFGVRLRSREIDQIGCVGDMVGLIQSKLG